MKIILASHSSADSAGAELALLELASGIAEDIDHVIHAVFPVEGPLVDHFERLGITTSVIPNLSWVDLRGRRRRYWPRYVASSLRSTYRLVRLFRTIKPDVVVTNTKTLVTPAVAARLVGIPHVWYVHEFGVRDHDLTFDLGYERSMRLIDRLSDVVIVNSRAIKADMSRWTDPEKLRLLYCAVEVARQEVACQVEPLSPSSPPLRLILVGRKAPGKGQEDAIRAVAALRGRGHAVELRLVGGGDPIHVGSLERLANELGVGDIVEFVEATSDVASQFRWSQIALVCSRAEAFGRVTVEAMKYGRPVIGADSEGTAELIEHGSRGLLYTPGDPYDLADKITELAEDTAGASRLAHNAKTWAEPRFSSERYVSDFVALITEMGGEPVERRVDRVVARSGR